MRSTRTESEDLSLSLLAQILDSRGLKCYYAPDITDRPDALCFVNEHAIAIECRYAAHPALLKFLGKRRYQLGKSYEVVVPREPHLWVRDAILEKQGGIPSYLERTGAQEAWLLLHSSRVHRIHRHDPVLGEDGFLDLLRLGAFMLPHPFSRVWFAELSEPPFAIAEIFSIGAKPPSIDFDSYLSNFVDYPVDKFWFAQLQASAGSDNKCIVTLNLNDVVEPVYLQPLDKRFTIDYAKYAADTNRSSNLRVNYAVYSGPPSW